MEILFNIGMGLANPELILIDCNFFKNNLTQTNMEVATIFSKFFIHWHVPETSWTFEQICQTCRVHFRPQITN